MTKPPERAPVGAVVEEPLSISSGPQSQRPSFLSEKVRGRLMRLLVIKASCEAAFVIALATGFYFSNFSSNVEGGVKLVNEKQAEVWFSHHGKSGEYEIQLFIDGQFSASTVVSPPPNHGSTKDSKNLMRTVTFSLEPASEGEHEARAYVVEKSGERTQKSMHLLGRAVRFRVEGNVRN